MTAESILVNVLFGTVTGNAEEIATNIHSVLPEKGFQQGHLRNLAQFADIPAFTTSSERNGVYNVIVVSTTGDGDPPETTRPFMKLLRSKDPSKLSGLNFAVLGLGDTNYENFCRAGKRIDTGLSKLGASRFLKRGDADDGTGLELVVEPWLKSLWTTLTQIASSSLSPEMHTAATDSSIDAAETSANLPSNKNVLDTAIESVVLKVTAEQLGFDESKLPPLPAVKHEFQTAPTSATRSIPRSVHPAYDPSIVHAANVTAAKTLTAPCAEKNVWHMELKCNVSDGDAKAFVYRPGDAFGIFVKNTGEEVERFLSVTRMDGTQTVRITSPEGKHLVTTTIKRLVEERIDVRALPSKTALRVLSEFCKDESQRRELLTLCSRTGRAEYNERISRPGMTVLEVLEKLAPSCTASIAIFLDLLPAPGLRWYSATSSPILDGTDVLHFTFSVVPDGLATPALAQRCNAVLAGETVEPVLLMPRESDSVSRFRPPVSLETSYVMIGPGTGVAPFRGFLRERRALLRESGGVEHAGKTMLFFGCRRREEDYLYQDDLQDLVNDDILTVLDVAFSRESASKFYVQDLLTTRKHEVAELIQQGGFVFVCGDGGGMAVGVHNALTKIVTELLCEGSEDGGKELMKKLSDEHRYVRDIWFYG